MIGVVRENPEYVSILAQVEVIVNRRFGKRGNLTLGRGARLCSGENRRRAAGRPEHAQSVNMERGGA